MKKFILIACFLSSTGLFAEEAIKKPAARTTITSDRVEMSSTDTENLFKFSGHVKVVGNNIVATSDEMEVSSNRVNKKGNDAKDGFQVGEIEKIIAKKHVRIEQNGRIATSEHAEIFPKEGKAILSENPMIEDNQQGKITGKRIILHQGERRVVVEGDETTAQRPTIVLPEMPDLGFDDKKTDPKKQEVIKKEETKNQPQINKTEEVKP